MRTNALYSNYLLVSVFGSFNKRGSTLYYGTVSTTMKSERSSYFHLSGCFESRRWFFSRAEGKVRSGLRPMKDGSREATGLGNDGWDRAKGRAAVIPLVILYCFVSDTPRYVSVMYVQEGTAKKKKLRLSRRGKISKCDFNSSDMLTWIIY